MSVCPWSDVECLDDVILDLVEILLVLEKNVDCQISVEVVGLDWESTLESFVWNYHTTQMVFE